MIRNTVKSWVDSKVRLSISYYNCKQLWYYICLLSLVFHSDISTGAVCRRQYSSQYLTSTGAILYVEGIIHSHYITLTYLKRSQTDSNCTNIDCLVHNIILENLITTLKQSNKMRVKEIIRTKYKYNLL